MLTSSDAIRSIRVRGMPHLAGQRAGRQFEWNEKFLAKNFSGMHGRKLFGHSLSQLMFVTSSGSVIVRYLNLHWAFRGPNKANPELVVNSDRMLPRSITFQGLKTIAGWRC